jgi:hypothetical protein
MAWLNRHDGGNFAVLRGHHGKRVQAMPSFPFLKPTSLLKLGGIFAVGTLLGCASDNRPPELDPLLDQTAIVNSELKLVLSARDADGDALTFGFASSIDVAQRSSLSKSGQDRALFRYTPLASDVGIHTFDFRVSDAEATTTVTVAIEVRLGGEGSTAPYFVQPLGTGTTLDLSKQSCVEFPVVVEDSDSASVSLSQRPPLVEGAEFAQSLPLEGSWRWCPSKEQVAADDRYTIRLAADDGENAATLKDYLVVLRSENQKQCPGEAPSIEHQPESQETLVDVPIVATVKDDLGIKYEPLLYYSLTPPAEPLDLGTMLQLSMKQVDGDARAGAWQADIPNPVANQPAGSTAQIYYVIAAQDDDDPDGTCDHTTQVPETGVFQLQVTNPGGAGGLGLCEKCSADAQCGKAGDHCVFLSGDYHCFSACSSSQDCPDDYYCSFGEFTSIDNAKARQCIPNDFVCKQQGSMCVDDSYEENDTFQQAKQATAIPAGTLSSLKVCLDPGADDDEDWYKLELTTSSQLDLGISGGSDTDLDLGLMDSTGIEIAGSDSLSSSETLSICLSPGTYYARVYSWDTGSNSYSLSYQTTAANCGPPGGCQDDGAEDDDNASQARLVDLNIGAFGSVSNRICSQDDDWYEVEMFAGETLYASLSFVQTTAAEDLDIYVYDVDGTTNLSGCSEQTPLACDPLNGQSGSSNESLQWPIATAGTYYVVVHGWSGSENSYDICVGYLASHCP